METPVISVNGSPFDLGYQHGQKAKDAIRRNFQFYLRLWNYFGGVEEDQILSDARQFVPYIAKSDPELMEELKGLAKGSEMGFDEIVVLNSRWELNYAYISSIPTIVPFQGCTAYALTPEITKNHHTFIGQNWDYKPTVENSCIILHIRQEKKPDIIMHTEAGIIGHKGFNSAGIGVCLNFIRTEKDTFKLGLPLWIKVRSILNCESLPDCMKTLIAFEGPNSANMVIAHRDGEAINAECTPYDTFFLYPKQGLLTHTNHFLSPNVQVKDTGRFLLPDTVIRNQRVFRLFHDKFGELQSDTIKEVLMDHFGHPDSICRHRDERVPPNEQWETLTSMIIDLTEGKMLYTNGPPCSNSYEAVSMANLG